MGMDSTGINCSSKEGEEMDFNNKFLKLDLKACNNSNMTVDQDFTGFMTVIRHFDSDDL